MYAELYILAHTQHSMYITADACFALVLSTDNKKE